MIDFSAARRLNRLRWLEQQLGIYRERRYTYSRLRRCASMKLAIDARYRGELGGSIGAYSDCN